MKKALVLSAFLTALFTLSALAQVHTLVKFDGFQRLSTDIAVIETTTDNLIGILPSAVGHHDCVIIPTELAHMKHTRSCTL